MSGKVFVPLTDEILYEHPELISGGLVPYVPGRACYHWLSVEINPRDDAVAVTGRRDRRIISFGTTSQTLDETTGGFALNPV